VPSRYRWNDLVLDLDGYRLERGGVPVPLEPKAFNLLALMIKRPGHLFSKQEIFEAVWPDTAVTDHALTRVVAQLRRGLGDEAREARYLETVPTRGYRWIHPVEAVVVPDALAAPAQAPSAPPTLPVPVTAVIRPSFQGLAAALVLGIAALVFLAWAQRNAPEAAASGLADSASTMGAPRLLSWPVQLTTHRGLDMHPSHSPHGDALAFVSDRSGAFEVYVRPTSGSAVDTPLTSDGGHNVQPSWSPDGTAIAFHSIKRGGIWVVAAQGGVPRQVAPSGSKPAWSPDSQQIAFQSDEHADVSPNGFGAMSGSTLWLVDAGGGQPRQITRSDRPAGGHAAPTWSPDGRFIAFTVFDAGAEIGLWMLNTQSGETVQLHGGKGLFESVFAPDGSALYVAGGEAFVLRIPLDAASGSRRGVPDAIPVAGVSGVRGLSISPDGQRLAFASASLDSQIWMQPMRANGSPAGEAVPLTSDTSRRNSFPVVSPDGTRVAYSSARRGELMKVWVVNRDGKDPIEVTSGEGFQPAWFPDSRSIAFISDRKTDSGLWSVNIETRRESPLIKFSDTRKQSSIPGELGEFQLSPSIDRAAFSLLSPPFGRRKLFVSDLNPYMPRALTSDDAWVGYPAWSPDARSLAVEVKSDEGSTNLAVVDVERGTLRQVSRDRGQTWVRSWSPDGRLVTVAAFREGAWDLRSIDIRSGEQRVLYSAAMPRVYVRYPDWSRRGDVIVFERGEMRGNIWTLALR
jgi:Tol biopolymer transport system component/DNA-binding winged helix-turn-helix (wHTH) protein